MDIERIRGVIAQMKLQEKIALACGGAVTASVDRLNVPSMDMGSALSPFYAEEPTALAMGCTFSPALCASVAKARSVDAARSRKAFAGAIGCGLITDPMRPDACGFFSEDSYLCAELLRSYAEAGVIGYVFTDALGQGRFKNRTVDSRALYELYLYPLIRAGEHAAALMADGGYLNGERVSTSRTVADMFYKYIPQTAMLITQEGCGGGADGISGGGAYQLDGDAGDKKSIARAVVDGTLFENKLNSSIERTVATVAKTHEFYKKPFDRDASLPNIVVDSTVLLKNDGLLPAADKKPTIFGDPAAFDDSAAFDVLPVKDAAKKYGTLNIFLITDYNDGLDDVTSAAICAAGSAAHAVVVLCGGAATEISVIEPYANAILYCPYCPSISAVVAMCSSTSPRGHLPFSWAESRSAYPRNNKKFSERGDFRYESVYNGYRLFNNFKSAIKYPFGHGLDYTSYDVAKFSVTCDGLKLKASFVIKNTGVYAGSALCQLYLTPVGGTVYGLNKRLVAFKRIALEATENSQVELEVDLNDFPVYDESNDSLVPIGGKYCVELGLSSRDIRASGEIKVPAGSRVNAGLAENLAPTYYKAGTGVKFEPTAPEIERLLKVPFIKKPDEYPDIALPPQSAVKHLVKRADKIVQCRLRPYVKYLMSVTPIK